jgi:hypothetical protein
MSEMNPAIEPMYRNQRSQRLHLAISVSLNGTREDGNPIRETTKTELINARGCLVGISAPVTKGQKLLLVNMMTKAETSCTVVSLQKERTGEIKAGLSFEQLIPKFWGIYFPPDDWNRSDRKLPETQPRPA